MKIVSKKLLVAAVAVSLALPVSFTFSQVATAATPVKGGDLTILRADLESSLTPSIPPDNAGIWVVEEIFDTLLVPAQDAKSLKPSLATSWSASKDGLTWTFKLRSGVKFSDERIAQAGRILDRAGPSAMYWMTDIAAQLAFLGAAQVNGITTNVNLELGESATPEQIVNVVVKG